MQDQHLSNTAQNDITLLHEEEVVLIVDDFPDIVLLLQEFLTKENIPSITANSAAGLHTSLERNKVALVLLDIGLPDADGSELLPALKKQYRDLSIIMLTGVRDLKTAMSCIRFGADDYLTKPVHFADLLSTIKMVLEKRRLSLNNRIYQRQLEQARFRLQLSHELSSRMNSVFLSLVELDEILQAILVGITAEEGLQFNRAFLVLLNAEGTFLEGRMAIGPGSREEGNRIWQNIREMDLDFHDLLTCSNFLVSDVEVNRIVKALRFSTTDEEHLLVKAVKTRKTIHVVNGTSHGQVPVELIGLLGEDSFVVVPLFSPNGPLGVIIADHFITGRLISDDHISALESFASQASLAIEHCNLYMNMEKKINELEDVTSQLEKNKNLLVDAERYSTVGHVAAQLAHNIRNPITSIGGTARLLARKTDDPEWLQFLNMMKVESEKIEGILEDLFSFVETVQPRFKNIALVPIITKSLLLHAPAFKDKGVRCHFKQPDFDPYVFLDKELIQKVLIHLIRNSIDAMPDGGELTVAMELKEDMVKIILEDTGVGIVDSNLNQVSEPFFTTKTVGAGIGLSLVQRIIEDHHGSFEIMAGKENGTRAVISLPI